MAISFEKMELIMQDRGKNKFYLRQHGINPNMLNQILVSGDTGTKTINKLCRLLNCQPGDIMQYIPDETLERDEKKDGEPQ